MGFASRLPTSNEALGQRLNPWGPLDDLRDDGSVLLAGEGKRCQKCRRVVLNEWLKIIDGKSYCPDHRPDESQDCPTH